MTDLLPHSRTRLLLTGVVTALGLLAVTAGLGASYLGVVSDDLSAQARLTTTGDSLGVGSDVKFRGLRVGRVLAVEAGDDPAASILLMDEHADQIPADVVARVLPSTLFGNEYVELVSDRGTGHLADGAVIPADRSAGTLRLMDTFDATQRLLVAVDPARLDAAVSELAEALDGRGASLAGFAADADRILGRWAEREPTFYRDLGLLARNVDTLADVEPQLVAALRDSLPTARTLADQERATRRLMTDATVLVRDVRGFLDTRTAILARTLRGTAATLEVFAARHTAFETLLAKLPAVLRNGATAIEGTKIRMNGALALTFPDPYGPEDCPRYGALAGPSCESDR